MTTDAILAAFTCAFLVAFLLPFGISYLRHRRRMNAIRSQFGNFMDGLAAGQLERVRTEALERLRQGKNAK